MIHVHHLRGCTPTALAHYLKALGLLRLVATQADPAARGWWRDECFHLATRLDRDGLLDFLARRYAPTPLVAPWNGGSGFYPKDNRDGIQAISASAAGRLAPYRAAIAQAAAAVQGRDESPKDEAKQLLLARCRQTWRGPELAWLDAAVVIDAELAPAYPSLLGTGGNDGRLDFTNNFMQRLGELFDLGEAKAGPQPACIPLAASALFADSPIRGLCAGAAIGQFLPGCAGGANSTAGFDGDSLVNPWDFVLTLEGALCFGAALSRRLQNGLPQASAPFALRSMAVGFGTAVPGEENARGEQWLPLWSQPATFADLGALLAEGRCQQGASPVRRPLEMARALARQGTARGIAAFQRFALLERNGQANLAIPVGRWPVAARPDPHQGLADVVAGWIERLEHQARGDRAPARWAAAGRRCSEALLALCRDHQPRRWHDLAVALGAAERELGRTHAQAAAAGLQPLPRLGAAWIGLLRQAAGDDQRRQTALRLALALADLDRMRRHWLPLDDHQYHFAEHRPIETIGDDQDALGWLAAVVRWRAIRDEPLTSRSRQGAALVDVAALLAGEVDPAAVLDLLGCCLVIERDVAEPCPAPAVRAEDLGALTTYGLLRLATMPGGLDLHGLSRPVPCDHRVTRALAAGAPDRALDLAVRRLRSAGLRPFVQRTLGDRDQTRCLTAALAFPLLPGDAARLARRLTKTQATAPVAAP